MNSFWFCAGAAALVLAGTYIFWGPSTRPKRKKKDLIPGMINLGNSCFLNAVLQAMAACDTCLSWLRDILRNTPQSAARTFILIRALLEVLESLNKYEDTCNAVGVIEALRSHRWIITNEEQDAHELFQVLTATIEEELTARNPVLSLLDVPHLQDGCKEEKVEESGEKLLVSSRCASAPGVSSPLVGLLASELKCNSCHSKSPTKCDSFDSISLVIPNPHLGQLTLQDLLLKFISCELLQDATCDACATDASQPRTTVLTKQLSFGKLPRCLCVHIRRTAWMANGAPVKCYDFVAFPELLVMDHFVHAHLARKRKKKHQGDKDAQLRLTGGNARTSEFTGAAQVHASEGVIWNQGLAADFSAQDEPSSSIHTYLLQSVIVHVGDVSSGHFVTYRRGPRDRWFCASDTEVKEVSLADVFRSCAYMLFYEKIGKH